MLINNTEKDIKNLIYEKGTTQTAIAKKRRKSLSQINLAIKNKNPLNKSFIEILETIGYDIQIEYVKRDETKQL